METPLSPVTSEQSVACENCQAQNASDKKFCSQCRYPITGTDEEKGRFRSDVAKHKILLKDAEDKIQSAKNIIYMLAGFSLLTGVILFFAQDDTASLVVYGVICVLYLTFAAWCSKNPFAAILTAFIVYVTIQVVFAFLDPVTIAQGIIWKVIFIGAFIKGIRSASDARDLIRELEKSKVEAVGSYY
jgi:hypothetical protein